MLIKDTAPIAEESSTAAGAGVLEKAMSLLNILSMTRAPMTFTELLRAGNLPKATLMREGLLCHDVYSKTYQMGFRLLELAHEVWSDFDLRLAGQDELVRLRNTVGETAQLAVLDGDSVVLIASEEAGRDLRMTSKVGLRLPTHRCCSLQRDRRATGCRAGAQPVSYADWRGPHDFTQCRRAVHVDRTQSRARRRRRVSYSVRYTDMIASRRRADMVTPRQRPVLGGHPHAIGSLL